MAEIEEVPIETPEIPQATQEADVEEVPSASQDVPKKGRGRPAGAKNKAKSKPAPAPATAKPKPKAKKKPIEYEEQSSEEEATPPPRRRREQPVEMDRHALASDVLNILQQQRYQRTNAKRSHYASWFDNLQ